MSRLPVELACRLATCPPERRWLIDELWAAEAVGIVGGEPKCCKSLLALDMAVAVAAGVPCLRRFPVAQPGRVLLYAAEDALHVVRQRLDGIARAAGTALDGLDIHVITAASVRLDLADDQRRLAATAAALRPRLLVLDPFVRLHRRDENVAAEVAPLLAYLRELQRQLALAVVLVHHARKGAGKLRAGQALRGSSELHAWGDSNLYLRRSDDQLLLSIEHRAAPSRTGLALTLDAAGDAVALHVVDAAPPVAAPATTPAETITRVLAAAGAPVSLGLLRRTCHLRAATLGAVLAALTTAGRLRKTAAGYELVAAAPALVPVPDTLTVPGNGNGVTRPRTGP
jgi:hypothetical protein